MVSYNGALIYYRRWIFTVLHGYVIGLATDALACKLTKSARAYTIATNIFLPPYSTDVNVGIGLAIFTYSYSTAFNDNDAPLWLYVAYAASIGVFYLLLQFLIKSYFKETVERNEESVGLTNREENDGDDEEDELLGKRRTCNKKTLHLWVSFGFYFGLTAAVVTALIVLVAI